MSGIYEEYARIKKQIRLEKEPIRVRYAVSKLSELGYEISCTENYKCVEFMHDGGKVKFYPYTGWHTGKTIKDSRGINNLLKQLK